MHEFLSELARTLTLDVPYNTSLVLRSVAVLGAACGLIGVFLLLRKRSLTADALAHAALPGVCMGFLIATAFGQDARSLTFLLPAAAIAGVLGVVCIHALNTLPRVREDASIGIVLSVFFAIGIVLLGVIQNMPVGQKAGLDHFILGQAATMTASDGRLIMIIAMLVLVASLALFKELRLLCFDPVYASGLGFSRNVMDGALMAMVTLVTVIGLHAVGALLIVGLLIIPAVAARFWTDRLAAMVVIAAGIGALGAYLGAAVSSVAERTPTGPSIIVFCGGLFVVSLLFAPQRGVVMHAMRQRSLRHQIARQHLLRAMFERGEIAGDMTAPVTLDDLNERRSWTPTELDRLLSKGMRSGELEAIAGGHALTPQGHQVAARIVRTHRLWEHYLMTHADVAPNHVDQAVEDIEHVLGEAIVAELEQELNASRRTIPESLHDLNEQRSVS